VLLPPRPLLDPDLARLDASAPEWAAGFIRPAARRGALRVVLADRYPYGSLEAVLTHEAAHQILHDAAGRELPRWFDEGVATREARRWNLEDMLVYSSALLTGGLPSLDEMDAAFNGSAGSARAAYAASSEFVAWTAKQYGDGSIRAIILASRTQPFPAAWAEATGTSLVLSEREWRQGSLFRYRWIPVLTGTTTLWIGVTLLALLAGARRRARTRAITERWEAEETGVTARDERFTDLRDDTGDEPPSDESETLH
jgi:hypothetical protein